MPIPNGLYKITFLAAQNADYGVAYMHDGKLRGGDSAAAYVGSYEEDGPLLSVQMCVTDLRRMPGVMATIGYRNVLLEMHGTASDQTIRLRGSSPQVPGVKFEARLTMLAD